MIEKYLTYSYSSPRNRTDHIICRSHYKMKMHISFKHYWEFWDSRSRAFDEAPSLPGPAQVTQPWIWSWSLLKLRWSRDKEKSVCGLQWPHMTPKVSECVFTIIRGWLIYVCACTHTCLPAVAQSDPTILWPPTPLSMGFSRQEYWSALPFLSPENFPDLGLNLGLLYYRQILYCLSHQGSPLKLTKF